MEKNCSLVAKSNDMVLHTATSFPEDHTKKCDNYGGLWKSARAQGSGYYYKHQNKTLNQIWYIHRNFLAKK